MQLKISKAQIRKLTNSIATDYAKKVEKALNSPDTKRLGIKVKVTVK